MESRVEHRDDKRIAVFLGLRDHVARQARERAGGDMAGSFIAEGDLVIERALAHGYALRSVLIGERRTSPLPESIPDDVDVFIANDAVLTEITGRPNLRDTLSCFTRPSPTPPEQLLSTCRTVAVLENVNNPNNLGVIIRNAAGLGVDAVLLDPRCGDPLYRRAIRASMGQVFTLPHARIPDLPDGLQLLHDHGITTVALTPSGTIDLRDVARPTKVAVILGAEGPGLTPATLSKATIRARIPMTRSVDSLNVANAAAIAFHHFAERSGE